MAIFSALMNKTNYITKLNNLQSYSIVIQVNACYIVWWIVLIEITGVNACNQNKNRGYMYIKLATTSSATLGGFILISQL